MTEYNTLLDLLAAHPGADRDELRELAGDADRLDSEAVDDLLDDALDREDALEANEHYLIQGESPAVYGGRESDTNRKPIDYGRSEVSSRTRFSPSRSNPFHVRPRCFFSSFNRSYCSSSSNSIRTATI